MYVYVKNQGVSMLLFLIIQRIFLVLKGQWIECVISSWEGVFILYKIELLPNGL